MKKAPALTAEEAFEKYFGKIVELCQKPYPWQCNSCEYYFMHLDQDWVRHLRQKHGERISNKKRK